MQQLDLLGNKAKQKWSCCHCPWVGYKPIIEKDNGHTFHICPKCRWVCWREEEAKEMTGIYSAFKKKYGD